MSYLFYYNRLGTPGWAFVESFEKKTVLKCLLYFKRKKTVWRSYLFYCLSLRKNAEQLKPILWDCAKEIESLLSEFETIESWAFILCRLILFESRLLEINLVKRLNAVKIVYLEDGYVKPDPIVIVELSDYFIRSFILWRWRDAC